jgi:hypothetical protein
MATLTHLFELIFELECLLYILVLLSPELCALKLLYTAPKVLEFSNNNFKYIEKYKNTNHQEMHKESFIINRNTLLHVSTLLSHPQGELLCYGYTKVALHI